MPIKDVMLFPSGTSVVCDEGGKQIPELQVPWFLLFLRHLEANGIDPTQEGIVYHLPGTIHAVPFKTENGYNWEVK